MHDFNPFADIKKLLTESHNKEQLEKLSTPELRKLRAKYKKNRNKEANAEAKMIEKEIESRGQDEKGKAIDESYVIKQNEELLAILDTLCEMAGLDMMTLVEETRKEMENLGRAYSWDKPAPAGEPHGKLAANARDILVKAARARGTRSERIAREREQFRAGPDFAERMADAGENYVHEPETGGVVKGLKALRGFDKIQSDIDDLAHKSRMAEEGKKSEMSPTMKAHVENLRRLAKPAAKKTKGKKKK